MRGQAEAAQGSPRLLHGQVEQALGTGEESWLRARRGREGGLAKDEGGHHEVFSSGLLRREVLATVLVKPGGTSCTLHLADMTPTFQS